MAEMTTSETAAPNTSRIINHSPVFYGWIIMLTGTLGMVMTSPGQTYSVSIFIEHFIADLGISRSVVSTLYTAGTLTASLALPLVGRQIDRRGSRQMVVFIALLFGLACIYMGFVRGAIMLGIGFVLIRMLGQGSLALVSNNVINQWWVRRRGSIMGISGLMASVFGLGTYPTLINWLIPILGWRSTYGVLGLSLILLMAPIGYGLFRNRPEDYGLRPDGGNTLKGSRDSIAPVAEENWMPSEAFRTRAFWTLVLGIGSIAALSTGLIFHIVSIFADSGLSPSAAAAVFLPIAISTALANFGSGLLIPRVPLRLMMSFALLLQAVALWMAPSLPSAQVAVLYGVVIGTLQGISRTANSVGWALYFGRLHLGSITGVTSSILVAASALGPMPMGIARDVLGSYDAAVITLSAIPLILAVLTLATRRPKRMHVPTG